MISKSKKNGFYLRPDLSNQLYSAFGAQLNIDRQYLAQLPANLENSDSLTEKQFDALLNLLISVSEYEKTYQLSRIVRRGFNHGEKGNCIPKNALQNSRLFLYSPAIRKTLCQNIPANKKTANDSLIQTLPATSYKQFLKARLLRNNDRVHAFFRSFVYAGSRCVGNSIGCFSRHSNREENARKLQDWLQPLDIIVLKSSKHLTDKFIPGYFGHTGIWLGNKIVRQIACETADTSALANKTVMEVLRSGVTFSTLNEFADGEEFLVIRLKNVSDSEKEQILENLARQRGKKYDFNFDIETPQYLTCTELVYLGWDFINWKPQYIWSRYTLSPDDLVTTIVADTRFGIPVFIDKNSIIPNPDVAIIRKLVDQ